LGSTASQEDLLQQLAALQAQLQALLREVAARGIAATQTASSSFQFTRDLKFGMAGDDVNELQLFLIRENTGPAARKLAAHGTTKNFATLTLNALIEFQKKAGIKPASGYFGPITRAKVNTMIAQGATP
jgi:murein L,D-transpeptidase YcbB/YkuD